MISHVDHIAKQLDTYADDISTTLSALNKTEHTECDKYNLIKMREALFESDYIKDIGFFKDEYLVCTTGKGLLDQPLPQTSPDAVILDEHLIMVDREFLMDGSDSSLIIAIQNGNYNVLFDVNWLKRIFDPNFIIGVHLVSNNVDIHLASNKKEHKNHRSKLSTIITPSIKTTSRGGIFELKIDVVLKRLLSIYKPTLFFGLIISAFVFIISYSLIGNVLQTRTSFKTRIKRGLQAKNFYFVYQPIVDIQAGTVIGCEVLARFKDNHGTITPDIFIPIIKETNKCWEFTTELIDTVKNEVLENEKIPENFKVSINIYPQSILSGDVLDLIDDDSLVKSDKQICLEITEDEQLQMGIANLNLSILTESGFQVALDDFGTGYSNFNQLKRLHCQALKIDKSFVSDVDKDALETTFIPHIISIADQLKVSVIAEGIETELQMKRLRDAGVKFGQGWHFAKPGDIDTLIESLQLKF